MNFELSTAKVSHTQSLRPARSQSVPPSTRLNVGNGDATRGLRNPSSEAGSIDSAHSSLNLIELVNAPSGSNPLNVDREAVNAELLDAAERAGASDLRALLDRGAKVDARDVFGRTALALAILHKNIPAALALIAEGADVNAKDDLGTTLALRACAPKCEAILQALIERGADLEAASARGVTPLMYSAANGCTESLNILFQNRVALDTEDDSGHTALAWASSTGCTATVKLLIKAGADARRSNGFGLTLLHVAVLSNAAHVLKELIRGGASVNASAPGYFQATPLALAAALGNEAALEVLIYEGADVNCRDLVGATPLHLAVLNGHLPAVKVLLERGRARVGLAAHGYDEATPLWLAASLGQLEALHILIKAGADVDVTNAAGVSPLHIAIEGGHTGVVEALLVSGKANPNSQWVASRRTPAMTAVIAGNSASLKLLIAANAKLDRRDAEGKTAMDHALIRGDAEVIALLESASKRHLRA